MSDGPSESVATTVVTAVVFSATDLDALAPAPSEMMTGISALAGAVTLIVKVFELVSPSLCATTVIV